ncbi:hypothetical protein E2C01_091170 [Portunus trituberculatus]|uniref:Uncharacterized protein n=1 Tax=Portunus trituberculatus TaxID=210409 RepID=A0A5B7JDA6_PORTR|nr:hypothetical protein [Portunus trituberculatus]
MVGRVCPGPPSEDSAVTFERLWKEGKSVNNPSTFIRFLPTFLVNDRARIGNDNDDDTGVTNKEVAVNIGDLNENTHALKQMVIEKALGIKGRSSQERGKLFSVFHYQFLRSTVLV